MTPTPEHSFLALERMHAELEELFLRHQEALLDLDLPAAQRLLDAYTRGTRLHVRLEETLVLPVYAQRATPKEHSRRPPELIYFLEHQTILGLLDKIHLQLRLLAQPPHPPQRDLISLLEREATFKHVIAHHHERETSQLFAELDLLTAEDERRAALTQCAEAWAARDAASA